METIRTETQVRVPDAGRITQTITLDLLGSSGSSPHIKLIQYDAQLPVVAVHLKNGTAPYTLPDGAAANVRMTKTDGKGVYNPVWGISADRCTVYVEISAQMTACSGLQAAVVEIAIGKMIKNTPPFVLAVAANPLTDAAYESTDEYNTLAGYIAQAKDAAVSADKSAAAAGNSADAAKASADAAAKSQESAAIDAKTATDAKVAAAGSADDAAGSATAAGNAAGAAAGSQQAAGASEEKAAASERAAKESEQAAAKSAEAALESKNAAATSEGNAAASAKKAQDVSDSLPADYTTAVNEIAALKTDKADKTELNTVKQQVESITPDDSTVGEKPWSSKNIVDMLCPPLEESGNPVMCYPVAGYPLGVKAKWEPVQEGSGTPYPAGGGKNLLDVNKCTAIEYKPYGLTATLDGDVFKISGIPNEEVTAKDFYSFGFCTCSQEELRGKGNKVTAWTIKGTVKNAWGLRTESEDGIAIAAELTPGVNTDIQFRLMVSKDKPTAWEPYENIRPIKGRDSVTVERCGENLLKIDQFATMTKNGVTFEYVPDGGVRIQGTATANTDSPTFSVWHLPPGKYYGLDMGAGITASITVERAGKRLWLNAKGTFEIMPGDITKYWYMVVNTGYVANATIYPYIVPGTTAPTTYTPYIGTTNTLTLPETVYGGEVDAVSGESSRTWRTITLTGEEQCHIYAKLFYLDFYKDSSFVAEKTVDLMTGKSSHYKYYTYANDCIGVALVGDAVIYSPNGKYPISDEGIQNWKAYLAAQYAAGTPVQVCYKLAEPAPFTATGAQPLPALAGLNTVLTDADSAIITGRADPIKHIEDLEAAAASQA